MAKLFTTGFEERTSLTDEFTFEGRTDRCDECSERVPDGERMNKVDIKSGLLTQRQLAFGWYDDLQIIRHLCDKCYLRERLEGHI